MPVTLSFEDNSRWETLVTHTNGKRFMIGAFIVDLIAELSDGDTILAFLIRLMFSLAFGL